MKANVDDQCRRPCRVKTMGYKVTIKLTKLFANFMLKL